METLVSLLIGIGVTFFFLRRYLKSLTSNSAGGAAAPAPSREPSSAAGLCPRCSASVTAGATFCSACGAPLALWKVHRSSVAGGNGGGQEGRPRPVINANLCIGCGSCVDACPETGTLTLSGGKAILANPESCTGHSRCVEVCPTSAIALAYGDTLQTLRVPSLDEGFETNVPGVFIVGELGGMALIKTAVNEGRLVMERIRQRLEGSRRAEENGAGPEPGPYDVVIVGAGPAGLSASLTAAQMGIRCLTLEQGEVASTIRQYPRRKFLMAEPIEMPLYGSLYVADGTKESLLSVWESIIANTGIQIQTNERVTAIERIPDRDLIAVSTERRTVETRYVVLAMGKRGTPRRLGVTGEDLGKVTYRLIEADTYEDSDVLVVGGGDSAVEAALALSRSGTNRVTLSYRGETFRRVRERNRDALSKAESEGRLRVLRSSQVLEIRADAVVLDSEGERTELPNQYVFVLIGGESPEAFLQKTGVEIVEKAISA